MQAIEEQMVFAIKRRIDWKRSNMEVIVNGSCSEIIVRLYGNKIAHAIRQPETTNEWEVTVYDGGHQTRTTKSRLNAILSYFCGGIGIRQEKRQWKLVDRCSGATVPFDGEYSFSSRF